MASIAINNKVYEHFKVDRMNWENLQVLLSKFLVDKTKKSILGKDTNIYFSISDF